MCIKHLRDRVQIYKAEVDELEELNESLRERDKTKDDAIAQLSDQLMTLTVRLQENERKQNGY